MIQIKWGLVAPLFLSLKTDKNINSFKNKCFLLHEKPMNLKKADKTYFP